MLRPVLLEWTLASSNALIFSLLLTLTFPRYSERIDLSSEKWLHTDTLDLFSGCLDLCGLSLPLLLEALKAQNDSFLFNRKMGLKSSGPVYES